MKRSFLKKEIVSIVVKFNFNKVKEQIQIIKGLFFFGSEYAHKNRDQLRRLRIKKRLGVKLTIDTYLPIVTISKHQESHPSCYQQ